MRYLGRKSVSSVLRFFLNMVWYIMIAAVVLILCALVIDLFFPGLIIDGNPDQLVINTPNLDIVFSESIASLNRSMSLLSLGFALLFMVVGILIIHELRRIFGALIEERPFIAENTGRIRRIGVYILAGAVTYSVGGFLTGLFLMNNLSIPGVELNPRFNLNSGLIFIGLVVLVLGEVFSIGFRLQEDQDSTV